MIRLLVNWLRFKFSGSTPINVRDGQLFIFGEPLATHAIIRELGTGKNGVVFKATNLSLNRTEAIKVWLKLNPADPRDKAKQALAEAQKVAKYHSEKVAQIFHFEVRKRHAFAAMEFVEGVTLRQYIQDNDDLRSRIAIGYEYLDAIAQTTKSDSLHGDPHWENVIVYTDDSNKYESRLSLKLIDFGTSMFAAESDAVKRHWSKVRETILGIAKGLENYKVGKKYLRELEDRMLSVAEDAERNPDIFTDQDISHITIAPLRDFLEFIAFHGSTKQEKHP